jgi:hypothetical protein
LAPQRSQPPYATLVCYIALFTTFFDVCSLAFSSLYFFGFAFALASAPPKPKQSGGIGSTEAEASERAKK